MILAQYSSIRQHTFLGFQQFLHAPIWGEEERSSTHVFVYNSGTFCHMCRFVKPPTGSRWGTVVPPQRNVLIVQSPARAAPAQRLPMGPAWRPRRKDSACSVGHPGFIPGQGRSPGEGSGNSLQYSCLGNPMDGGAWWAAVHGAAESHTAEQLTLSALVVSSH